MRRQRTALDLAIIRCADELAASGEEPTQPEVMAAVEQRFPEAVEAEKASFYRDGFGHRIRKTLKRPLRSKRRDAQQGILAFLPEEMQHIRLPQFISKPVKRNGKTVIVWALADSQDYLSICKSLQLLRRSIKQDNGSARNIAEFRDFVKPWVEAQPGRERLPMRIVVREMARERQQAQEKAA